MHRDSLGYAAGDPPARGQLDDRRPRHHAQRTASNAHARRAITCTASRPGWRCRRSTKKWRPASRTTAGDDLPQWNDRGVHGQLIAGSAYGLTAQLPQPTRRSSMRTSTWCGARRRRFPPATASVRCTSPPGRWRSVAVTFGAGRMLVLGAECVAVSGHRAFGGDGARR